MQYRDPDPFVLESFNFHLARTKEMVDLNKLKGDAKYAYIAEVMFHRLAATEKAIDQLADTDVGFGNGDWMVDLVEEFESLNNSFTVLNAYQMEYFVAVHDPETATDLWYNIYAAEKEIDPSLKTAKKTAKKK